MVDAPTCFRCAAATIALLAAALGVGCANAGHGETKATSPFQPAADHDVSESAYIVDPPDEITVLAPNIKELDRAKRTVRPDGTIDVPLVGVFKVGGLTPAGINDRLRESLLRYYIDPDIKCSVRANSKFFTVVDGTGRRQSIPYTGNDSVIWALEDAGFSPQAWPQQAALTRLGKNGAPTVTVLVDFTKIFEYGDMTQNYHLEPGDIIDARYPMKGFEFKFEQSTYSPITGATSVGGSVVAN